ncbi:MULTISPECIES: hypothetical protein [Rhizobium]|uniref:Restriction endonuclease type IV Mrr domain-containing protein n=1 Tax=Rhizobium rhododendri TaxID=2506430 RepID=A0ABY8IPB7_9HYPH|nr:MULTISPECIES: hypothetical protein [Rhizobium]QYA04131.1 hypothetical protein J5278_25685 [Rhizobium sp. B21/90]TQX86788.1 hypothetical protein EQW76_16665 [Rhizobium sp. rho-13.1]TQY11398.1 hypothetical protein EQW74_17980 [Rhizobium sp. rho-1.1]WFS24993.1 hypothetical protein PR018_22130 [Rhizobium rhododendri]
MTLKDINHEFVEVLKQIRELNVHFGFISRRSEGAGTSEISTVMAVLFELLSIRGARPDFWITDTDSSQPNGTELQGSNKSRPNTATRMIFRAIECYGADKGSVVIVSSLVKSIRAAKEAGILGILCSSGRGDENILNEIKSQPDRIEITDMDSLSSAIGRILGIGEKLAFDVDHSGRWR